MLKIDFIKKWKAAANELEIPEEDIEMVSSSANVSEEEARNELRKTKGDIAEAISNLKK